MNKETLVAVLVAILAALAAFGMYQDYQQERLFIERGYCKGLVDGAWQWRPCPGPAWEALPKVGESR